MKKLGPIRTLGTAMVLGLLLGGCAGRDIQGEYTKEQSNAAKQKLDILKAGLEYQTALGDFMAGDFAKALKAVENCLAMNEKSARGWTLRGRIMLEIGNLEGSLQSLARSEELDPALVDTQYYLGIVAERLDRKDDALRRYSKACELDPGNAQYAVAASEMMIDLGKIDEARTFLENRGPTLTDSAAIRQALGQIAMIQKDYPRAEHLFNEARLLSPNDNTMLENLAQAQVALAHYADAEGNLRKLLKDPQLATRRDLLHMRARCLTETDRNVEAREILIKLCNDAEAVADVEMWTDLGHISYKLNDMNRVRTAGAKIIAIAPRQPEGYLLKALWERKRGDVPAAKTSVLSAIERGAGSDAYVLMASIQIEQHDTAGATKTLATALEKDPGNTTARQMLAQVTGGSAQRVASEDPAKN